MTRVGTLDYMAPEVVVCPDKHHPADHKELTHLHYTAVVDAWAVGVLAYELVVGKAPFDKVGERARLWHYRVMCTHHSQGADTVQMMRWVVVVVRGEWWQQWQ